MEGKKQRDAYLCYRSVLRAGGAASLGGKLVLLSSPESTALERAAGARIAGAAALLVLENEAEGKLAVRDGACDFLVTGLDEALRILKNEVRKGAPVAVCLRAAPAPVLLELVARGVQPDLLDAPQSELVRRGARTIAWHPAVAHGECWVEWRAGSARALAEVDGVATDLLDWDGGERRRWLGQAPLVLGRAMTRVRWLPMRAEECSRLVAAVAASPQSAAVTVEREGTVVWPTAKS